jgi:hypothetical protein
VKAILSERGRARIYQISAALTPILVSYGLVNDGEAALWLGLAGAVLGAGTPAMAAVNTRKRV